MKKYIYEEIVCICLRSLIIGKMADKIILITIFLIFIILPYEFKFNKNKVKVQNEKNDTIKILPREEALDNGLSFIQKCVEGILINKTKIEKVENPRISVVIPCYNCNLFIKAALLSVQNQNMKDIEIIIIDDKSDNETLNLLNALKKEEPRLEVYYNKKNMKTFYTRSIGVLKSRSKYVFILDRMI